MERDRAVSHSVVEMPTVDGIGDVPVSISRCCGLPAEDMLDVTPAMEVRNARIVHDERGLAADAGAVFEVHAIIQEGERVPLPAEGPPLIDRSFADTLQGMFGERDQPFTPVCTEPHSGHPP